MKILFDAERYVRCSSAFAFSGMFLWICAEGNMTCVLRGCMDRTSLVVF